MSESNVDYPVHRLYPHLDHRYYDPTEFISQIIISMVLQLEDIDYILKLEMGNLPSELFLIEQLSLCDVLAFGLNIFYSSSPLDKHAKYKSIVMLHTTRIITG